ncbi:MAG: replication-associated recombination protein A, partial [Geminicoccales bacterium]
RLVRMASEDIGLADASALPLAIAASQAYEQLGSPEGELALAECALHLALAPKSNATYRAFGEAMQAARESGSLMPPMQILNAPTRLMKDLGYGGGYAYDHDAPDRFSGQDYFPDGMERRTFYRPTDQGAEAALRKRLETFARLRRERAKAR